MTGAKAGLTSGERDTGRETQGNSERGRERDTGRETQGNRERGSERDIGREAARET